MIDSLSRAGLVPATPSSAPAASARAPAADAGASPAVGGYSGDEGVTTSIGGQADPSPAYGPTGRFDVAVITEDDSDPDVDATAADDGSDGDDDDSSATPDVGTGGRGAAAVREYLAVWSSGPSSGDSDDGGEAEKQDAGSLSATA